MSFLQQMLLFQATSALNGIIRYFGAKYFTELELQASSVVVEALTELPMRIHNGGVTQQMQMTLAAKD